MNMRILIVNYRYFISGGPERYLFNIKKMLESHGHIVLPFSIKSNKNVENPYEDYFVDPIGKDDFVYFDEYNVKSFRTIVDVIARQFYSRVVEKKIIRFIRVFKPDVAYILQYNNKLSPSVIAACKKCRLPVIVRISDFFLLCPQAHFFRNNKPCEDCLSTGYFSCVRKRCIRNSYIASIIKWLAIIFHRKILRLYDNKVDRFICTTEFMYRKMIMGGFKSSQLTVIPTFCSRSLVLITKKIYEHNYILYFGRFSEEKGVETLINAFLKSKTANEGIRLRLIGGNKCDIDQRLLEKNKNLPIDSFIEFIPFLDKGELDYHIASCLFVVHPCLWYENLPNSVLEAYAFGKAVLAPNIGSMPEQVIDDVTGLLFNPGDIMDFANKIDTLALNEGLRERLQGNIAEFLTKFDKDAHYSKLMNIFFSLVKKQ